MELTVRPEPHLDFAETARLANESFGAIGQAFSPDRLEWLYRRAFSHGTLVLGLFAGDRKVGQVGLIGQSLSVGDRPAPAVALVDLFILPAFRSRDAIAALYGRVEAVCRERGIRYILAVPNGKAVGVNRKFLQLDTAATLAIRAGVAVPLRGSLVRASASVPSFSRESGLALLRPFEQAQARGLRWTAEGLWERLQEPAARYALHATDTLLMITAPKTRRRMPIVLICGMLARPGVSVATREVRALVSDAARLHRRPMFVYVGRNGQVPLPGWAIPERIRPSMMIVQARDLGTGVTPDLERFELVDFDFA